MEQIFTKLCSIAENSEADQSRKSRRQMQKARIEEKLRREKEEAQRLEMIQEKIEREKNRVQVFSENYKKALKKENREFDKLSIKRNTTKAKEKEVKLDETEKESRKNPKTSGLCDELSTPSRDLKKFDANVRARELFAALDYDKNGLITETEFIKGCTSDEVFVKLLDDFSGDFIWGY